MRLIIAVCLVITATIGCGTDCRSECEAIADELVSVWGISSPCTEPEWDDAEDCAACDRTLEQLYGLTSSPPLCED